MKNIVASVVAFGLLTASAGAASTPPRMTDFHEIRLKAGPNLVPHFTRDGRAALITTASRANFNAHSYTLWVVMLPSRVGGKDWEVVAVDYGDRVDDALRDDAHTSEDYVTSVVFARARLNGRRGTYLIVAKRDLAKEGGIPEPSLTTIDVFDVKRNTEGEPGWTTDYFKSVVHIRTRRLYCNSQMALHRELGIPLPRDYQGSAKPSGCNASWP